MQQTIASGYISKIRKLPKNKNLTEDNIEYTGDLKIDKKLLTVQVYIDKNSNKELFIRISTNTVGDVYGMIKWK